MRRSDALSSFKEGGCMLCVWTSPPSKVLACSMSAPVVVNQYPLWVIFRRQAARCTMVVCKGEGRDSFCGGAWSTGWLCPNSHADANRHWVCPRGFDPRCLHSLERPLRLLWEWCSSAVFICRPHSCLSSAIDMARPRGCAPDSLPSLYGYNGRQMAPGD